MDSASLGLIPNWAGPRYVNNIMLYALTSVHRSLQSLPRPNAAFPQNAHSLPAVAGTPHSKLSSLCSLRVLL